MHEVAVWSGLLVTLTGIRFLHFKGHENEQRYIDDPGRWVLRLSVASGVSGCLWGIGLVLLLPEPLLYRLFVAFVLGGMAAGSVATLLPLLPVVTAFLLPCMLPLTIRLALEGSSRLARHVRLDPAVHLRPMGGGLEAEQLDFHHTSPEDGEEPACR